MEIVKNFETSAMGLKPKAVPVVLWSKGPYIAEYIGAGVYEYYTSNEINLKAQISLQNEYSNALFIPGIWPDIGPVVEASAFGCDVYYPEGQSPYAKPGVKISEINSLKTVDPYKDGFMPKMLNGWRYLWDNLNVKYIETYGYLQGCASIFGPLETAAQLLGYEQFFLALYDKPKLIHNLLEVITESTLLFLRAQEKINGKLRRITVTDHTPGSMNMEHFEEFGMPYFKNIFDAYPDAFTIYHNESNVKHILSKLKYLDFKIFHMGLEVDCDYSAGIKLTREIFGGKKCLMGNIHSQELLLWGKEQEVYDECIRQLDVGAIDGAMLLSVRGGFAPGTPRNNIHAMINAARDWDSMHK